MGLIGHNGGPSLQGGYGWRRHCWQQARQALLPTLPIEVLRNRVKRAAELGLEYRSYASVRAQTGHDVVAFLFSSNALKTGPLRPQMPQAYADKLAAVVARKTGLAVAPLTAAQLSQANPRLDHCAAAPWALASWGQARAQIRASLGKLPGDRVVLIGSHGLEADWVSAGGLAGFIPAERYFGRSADGV